MHVGYFWLDMFGERRLAVVVGHYQLDVSQDAVRRQAVVIVMGKGGKVLSIGWDVAVFSDQLLLEKGKRKTKGRNLLIGPNSDDLLQMCRNEGLRRGNEGLRRGPLENHGSEQLQHERQRMTAISSDTQDLELQEVTLIFI